MLGEDDSSPPPPLPPPLPPLAAAGGCNRNIYSRSVSWTGSLPVNPNPRNFKNSKSIWNTKVRLSLPPLSVSISKPNLNEWPDAGLDDIGIWPNTTTTTPRSKQPLNVNKLECSKIIDHVFLGNHEVAKNRNVLYENRITHVLNCVGFACPEYFKNDIVYKTLWLRDNPTEDITSILYDVFDYFEDVQEQKGRILVHCCQGVSRSTSLVIAYLMWKKSQTFEESFQEVKSARGSTDPNMGFACQLLQCQKWVNGSGRPVDPDSGLRMFRIAPHSSYSPLHLVPKLLPKPSLKSLDSRGAFIIHFHKIIYVWIGKNCVSSMLESANLAALQVIKYENTICEISRVIEGEEPVDFWLTFSSENERCGLGEKRVVDYDLDFKIFEKAVIGGVVPPLGDFKNNCEMCLPARQSGWERLRRKFTNGVVNWPNNIVCKENYEDQLSSFHVKRLKKVH